MPRPVPGPAPMPRPTPPMPSPPRPAPAPANLPGAPAAPNASVSSVKPQPAGGNTALHDVLKSYGIDPYREPPE
jgi:hypothetical protein